MSAKAWRIALLACVIFLGASSSQGKDADEEPEGRGIGVRLVELVNKTIEGRLDVGAVEFKLPHTVVIRDAVLKDPNGATVMTVGRIEVEVLLHDLLHHEIHATHIALDTPHVDLVAHGDSYTLLDALKSKKQKNSDAAKGRAVFEAIEVRGADVRYDDTNGVKAHVAGVTVNASGDVDLETSTPRLQTRGLHVGDGTMSIGKDAHDTNPVVLAIGASQIDALDLFDKNATIKGGNVKVNGASIVVDGTANLEGAVALAGRVQAPRATTIKGVEVPFALPSLNASFTVGGALKAPIVSIAGETGSFAPSGVSIDRADVAVSVDKTTVTIDQFNAHVGEGVVHAHGTYGVKDGVLDVRADGDGVPVARIARAMGTSEAEAAKKAGSIAIETRLHGATKGSEPLVVDAAVKGDLGNAKAGGKVFVDGKKLDLDVDAQLVNLDRVVALPAEGDSIGATTVRGTVSGSFDAPRFAGSFALASARVDGVPAQNVHATLDASKAHVVAQDLGGVVAGGVLAGDVDAHLVKHGAVRGHVAIAALDLATLEGPAAHSSGFADVVVDLSGDGDDPVAHTKVVAQNVVVHDEQLGSVDVVADARETGAVIERLLVDGPDGRVTSTKLAVGYGKAKKERALSGHVVVDRVDLARIHAVRDQKLQGRVSGVIDLAGSLDEPDVTSHVQVAQLAVQAKPVGDGDVRVHMSADKIVDAIAVVGGPGGHVDARGRIDLGKEDVDAHATLQHVDIAPWIALAPKDSIEPLAGVLDGTITAKGAFARPDVDTHLRVAHIVVQRDQRALKPIAIDARLHDAALDATIAALGGVNVHATGPVDVKAGTFTIDADADANLDDVEEIVPQLRKNETALDVGARGHVVITRHAKDEPIAIEGSGTLAKLRLKREGAPELELARAVDVKYENDLLQLPVTTQPLLLESANKRVRVTASATVGPKQADVDVDGTIPLALAKIATDAIANATGTADVKMKVRGDPSAGLQIEGTATPRPESTITPRSTGERITFLGGGLRFAPADDGLVRVIADNLRVDMGGGEAVATGSALVHAKKSDDKEPEPLVASWDLAAKGDGLYVKQGETHAEVGFDLTLKGASPSPSLQGTVQVVDGDFKKTFAFGDFVMKADVPLDAQPLDEQLRPVGLDKMKLDVAVSVRDFRAQAEVPAFKLDAYLQGDVRVKDTVATPRMVGALGVEQGEINFPKARFEITDFQLELPTGLPGSSPKPTVYLAAHADIPPGTAGNDATLPVDMTLDGPIDAMKLDFVASGGGYSYTRADLLALVVFGKPLTGFAQNGSGAGWRGAMGLVSGQASAALTKQLSDQIEKQFGGQLELNLIAAEGSANDPRLAAGWRWRVGQRLDLEGTAGLGNAAGAPSTSTTTQAGANAARMRLLLFDHLPVGDQLALEGSVLQTPEIASSTETELRVDYRIFEGRRGPSAFAFLFPKNEPGPEPHAAPRPANAPPALTKVVAHVHGGAEKERADDEKRVQDSLASLFGQPMGTAPAYSIVSEATTRLRAIGRYRRIECAVVEPVSGGVLGCDVTKARVVRDVKIAGLPESMLEADVRHRVGVESGDVLDPVDVAAPAADAAPHATSTAGSATEPPAPTTAAATEAATTAALDAKLDARAKSVLEYLERVGFHGAHVSVRAVQARGADPSQVEVNVAVDGGHWVHVRDVVASIRDLHPQEPQENDASGTGTSGADDAQTDDAHKNDDAHDNDDAGDDEVKKTTVVRMKKKAHADDALDPDRVAARFKELCWKPDGVVDAMFRGSLACYSQERVRNRVEDVERDLRSLGYPEARVRVTPSYVDPHAGGACADGACVDLRVRVRPGPKVTSTFVVDARDAKVVDAPSFFTDQALWFRHKIEEPVGRLAGGDPDDDVVLEDLKRALTFDTARSADEAEAQVSADALEKLLQKRGHPHAKVDVDYKTRADGNVDVTFKVHPGPAAVVRELRIEGITDESEKKLAKQADLRTKVRSGFASGFVTDDMLAADDESLRRAMKERGYAEATVTHQLAPIANAGEPADDDTEPYTVVFRVEPGEKYVVKDVELKGGDPKLQSDVLSVLSTCKAAPHKKAAKLKPADCDGGPLRVDELDADTDAVKAVYASKGYPNVDVTLDEAFARGGAVKLRVDVTQPGSPDGEVKKAVLGDVFVLGNTTTNSGVIRRELGATNEASGKTLDPVLIQAGVNRLRRTGLYSRVTLDYVGIDAAGAQSEKTKNDTGTGTSIGTAAGTGQTAAQTPVDVVVRVEEKPSFTVDSSVAFSSERLFDVGLEAREKNAFGSMVELGGILDFGLFIGRFSQLQLPARWPRILGSDFTATLTPFASYRDESSGINLHGNDPVAGAGETFLGNVPRRRIAAAGAAAGIDYALNAIPGINPDTLTVGVAYELRSEWVALHATPYPLFSSENARTISGLTEALAVPPARIATLTPRIFFSDIDNPFDPLRGVSAELLFKASSPLWASQHTYGILGASGTGYTTFNERVTLAGRVSSRWGFVDQRNLACTDCGWALMQNDLLLLGGERSVRGYGENTIGVRSELFTPTLAAVNAVGPRPGLFGADANVEVRVLAWKNLGPGDLKPAVFVDSGVSTDNAISAFNFADRLRAHELGLSVGAGLRYVMPVGPAVFDCAVSPIDHTANGGPVAGCDLALGYIF